MSVLPNTSPELEQGKGWREAEALQESLGGDIGVT